MLTQLRNAGKFDAWRRGDFGCLTNCVPEYPEKTLELSEIFAELIVPAGKPVLMGLACGHCIPTLSLPLGAPPELDADARTLEVTA